MCASSTFKFLAPAVEYHSSWLEAQGEFAPDAVHHGGAQDLGKDLHTEAGFRAWVEALNTEVLPGRAPSTMIWLIDNGKYVGTAQLRHELTTEYLQRRGGHIGYEVRPSYRGQGCAQMLLSEMLRRARALGLSKVMLTCAEDNPASAAVILKGGGVEEIDHGESNLRRFWICL